jgi:hypothetical protein
MVELGTSGLNSKCGACGATAPSELGGEPPGDSGARVSAAGDATAIALSSDDGVCPWEGPTRFSGFTASSWGRATPSLPRLLCDRRSGEPIVGAAEERRSAPRRGRPPRPPHRAGESVSKA